MSLQLQKRQEANRRDLQSAYLAQDYLSCIMAAGYSPLDEIINRSADPSKGAPASHWNRFQFHAKQQIHMECASGPGNGRRRAKTHCDYDRCCR